jgi:hypothetical protein
MATLSILEAFELARSGVSGYPAYGQIIQTGTVQAKQKVPISGVSTQSAPFSANSHFVRIETDTTCVLEFGASPTADTTSVIRMVAGQTEYFGVLPGQMVAVLASA